MLAIMLKPSFTGVAMSDTAVGSHVDDNACSEALRMPMVSNNLSRLGSCLNTWAVTFSRRQLHFLAVSYVFEAL